MIPKTKEELVKLETNEKVRTCKICRLPVRRFECGWKLANISQKFTCISVSAVHSLRNTLRNQPCLAVDFINLYWSNMFCSYSDYWLHTSCWLFKWRHRPRIQLLCRTSRVSPCIPQLEQIRFFPINRIVVLWSVRSLIAIAVEYYVIDCNSFINSSIIFNIAVSTDESYSF